MHSKPGRGKLLLLLFIIISAVSANAQNLNNPNKLGPLGTQVNTLSGNLFIPRTDIYIPARTFDLDITFFYNSFLFTEEYGYGKGWTFAFNIKYSHDTTPGARLILWGDGREDKYDSLPGGAFKSPRGFYSKLIQQQPGQYVLIAPDSVKFFFNNAVHKRITRMEDPNGNYINFTYTGSLLTAMTNNAGQSITFSYDPQGHLATVTDAIAAPSRTFTYTYDAVGNLKEVKDPLNGKYKYSYLINGPMKTITDRNNNTVDIIYFPDLTTSELIGCNKRISFSYDTASQATVVTDHMSTGNQVTTYTYQKLENLQWITSMSGNCCGFNMKFEYDDQGNQTKITDANGQVYKYTYDATGNLLTATDPLGEVSTYTYSANFNKITSYTDPKGNLYTLGYDADGNMTQLVTPGNNIYTATYNAIGDILSSTDPKGNSYTYSYDAYGNPVNVTGANGYHAALSFDARGNLLSVIDARGNSNTAEYDILSRLKKITDPVNNFTQFNYDAEGNMTSYINKNNETSLINYDASNRPVKFTGPTGNQMNIGYDEMDKVISVKNALGNETKYSYDTRNRMKGAKDPQNNNAQYDHDGNGNITTINFPNGRSVHYTYDQRNRIISISDASGIIMTYTYDKNGNRTGLTNGTGAATTATYDNLNRIQQITDPLGNSVSYIYDNNNNIITVTDKEGKARHYTYDSLDRVKTFTNNNGFVITVGYDAESNITSLKDQNNNITIYTYDSLNRRKTMTYPDGKYRQYTYDKKNNITAIRLTDATTITYVYDTLNRISSRILPGGEVFGYTYDKLNRVTAATNNSGTVTFTYDNLDRVTSESFDGRTTSYSYNIAGRTQAITYPDGTKVIKEFDARNRLTRILKDSIPVVEYSYNNANQRINKNFGNGIQTTLQYDFANRLSSISTLNGTIQNSNFTYDKQKNKTAITRLNNPGLSEQFTYDNGYRLTNYKRGPAGSPTIQNTYTYDAVGNRIAANLNGAATTYTVNNLNQLTSRNSTSFTFDDRGNITYDGTFYKTYDAENRLKKDSASPSAVITYSYDAMGRRIAKSINGATLKYTYSGAVPIEERNSNNVLLNRVLFAGLLSPVLNEKNGEKYYYHSNEMGSVEAISNSSGRLIESYRYDVYGKQSRYDSLNNPLNSSIAGNRFGFTGQEYDSASGSNRFFFRNYSPETGVFNQRDLIEYKDGMGMYQYVGNNPANGVDVWGLELGYGPDYEPPIPPPSKDPCPPGSGDLMSSWDWLSDKKAKFELFAADKVKIPGLVKTPMDLAAPFVDLYKTAQSLNSVSTAKTSTEKAMYVGDAMKNGASSGAGFGGIVTGLMEGGAAEAGAGIAEGAAATTAAEGGAAMTGSQAFGLVGLGITGADIETQIMFDLTVTEAYRKEAFDDQLFADEGFVNQGKDRSERVQRLIRWDMNERIREDNRYRWAYNHRDCPPGGGSKKLRYWFWDPVSGTYILRNMDPNLIIGPEGQPDKKWVSVNDRLPYTILFENDTTASARVRYVKITSPIEPKQDPATLELGNFGFNNQSFNIPAGSASYYQRLDCRDSTGLYVDIIAGYDVVNNQIFWEFQGVDPVTLLPPDDPLVGFLFLHDSLQTDYGKGFVNFSIKPIASAQTLDTIGARAFIVFDINDTLPTNIHTNTIDAVAPTSQMNNLPGTGTNPITLSWTGTDDPNGSGINYYTIYVSTDQINYSVLIPRITRLDTTLTLPPDSNYCFFSLATDRVGNTETLRPGVIKCSSIGGTLPVTLLYFNGTNMDKNNLLKWGTASEQNSKEFRLERSLNGSDFNQITVVAAAGNSPAPHDYQYIDRNIDQLNSNVMFYRLKQVDIDNQFKYSNIVRLHYRKNGVSPSIVYPNPTKGSVTIVVGDNSLVGTEAVVTDINGRILQKVKITGSSQSFNLSSYVNGLYLIRLSNKETLKVVKQ